MALKVKQNSIYVQNGEDPKAVLAMMYKNMMQMKMPDNLSTPSQTDLAKASTTGASLVPGPTPVLLARTIGTSSIPGQAPLARTTITKASPITFQEPKASTTIPAGNVKPVAPRASDKGFEKLVQGYVSQTPVRMPEELRAEEAKNKMWVARKEAESRILAARREAENGVYLIFREQPLSSINYPAMFTKYRTFWVKREIKTWIDNLKKEYDPEKAIMSWAAERTKNRARKENVEDEEEYEAVWTRYYSEISEVADNENIVRGDKLVTSGVPIFSMITKVRNCFRCLRL